MLEDLTEDYQRQEFEVIAPYVTGKGDFPQKKIIIGIEEWFRSIGYEVVEPYQNKEFASTQRHQVCEFFNTDKTFDLRTRDLVDTFLIYKEETVRGTDLKFAAALVVFEVCSVFFVMVTTIKVSTERRKSGIGSAFFRDVAQYISDETSERLYTSSYMVVHQYRGLNPHGFYKKLGFVDYPVQIDSWRMGGSDLAVCSLEQFYASESQNKNVYEQKAAAKIVTEEDKSEDSEEVVIPSHKRASESGSAKSKVHHDKHCHYDICGGKLITGANWSRHLSKVHEVKGKPANSVYTICDGIKCIACVNWKSNAVARSKGISPTRSYIRCSVCNEEKRQDKITQLKPKVICTSCTNKKQGKGRQNKKRTRTATVSEFSDTIKPQALELQENDVDDYRDEQSVINKYNTPSKRPNLDNSSVSPILCNTTAADTTDMRMQIDTTTTQGKALSSISQEQSGLTTLSNALQMVSTSSERTIVLSNTLLVVCELFVCEYAEKCIIQYKGTQLIDCINLLLDRVDMLPQHDMVGLLAAAFIIGQSCWQSALSALNITTKENRESLIQTFSLHIATTYDQHAAKWFEQYWKYSTDQQIEICKYFKTFGQEVTPDILTLSLVVQKSNIRDFVQFVQLSLSRVRVAVSMVLNHIKTRPVQPSISFDCMQDLISVLSSSKNQQAVLSQKEQLKQAAIVQWMDILEAAKTTVNIADAISIQHFLDELQTRYGPLTDLIADITQSDDDRFAMILDSIDIKPNNKQFALAQYGIGKLYSAPRQLWVVPSGQGKSRISAGMCMIALLCGSVTRVHMVFPNEELMKRDQADFENLFLFVTEGEQDIVSYHVGIDFKPVENALIIVDEADYFMFENPPKFQTFVKDSACICFTATPANSTVEQKVAAELKFEQYSYSLNDEKVIDKSALLMVDVTYTAPTAEEKAAHIKELAKSTPVLVYCDEELTKAIIAAGIPPVMIEAGVDHTRLRQLDKLNADTQHYTIIVSEKMLGMRGFDYRSEAIPMTLVIAKSFANKRDAVQGFSRVGRFGDKCSRERFTDVEIIDKTAETAQTLAMFKFVGVLKKTQVVLAPVQVKPVTTKYRGKNPPRQTQLLKK